MFSKRLERVTKELQRIMAKILQNEISDPRLGFVTVTRVVLAPDLKSAKIYISVIGDEKKQKESMEVLEHAHGYIQRLAGERLNIHDTPKCFFVYDKSIEKQIKITQLINETIEKDKAMGFLKDETNEAEEDEEDEEEDNDETTESTSL